MDQTLFALFRESGPESPLFPLIHNPLVFGILENAYAMLFPEVLIVVVLLARCAQAGAIVRWFAVFFAAYAIGLAVFVVLPVVGPPIHDIGLFDPALADTFTADLMRRMAVEFQEVRPGGRLGGFAYFVAFPSLHVAAAFILQVTLRNWPPIFWLFLPVNVLLMVSTVALGYHYSIDIAGGLILGALLSCALPVISPQEPTALIPGTAS
jgi:membrane-associated phospholipid phosphatase